MDHYIVKKSALTGRVTAPSSKSHTLRALLFASLGKGRSIVTHYLASNDTQAMIEACSHFGASVHVSPRSIEVMGIGGRVTHTEDVIQAGNSGIVLRFCSAVGALASHPVVITGDHSIRHQRPMRPLLNGLSHLGVHAQSMRGDGYAPVIIQGPIQSGKATISGEDSQPVSALLIASALAEGPVTIHVDNPGEKPWVALTLDWFTRLGIPYENHEFETYHLKGHACYEGFTYTVPGDFSSAAFLIAAALVTHSELTVNNIDMNDSQGDKELISVFQQMGAAIEIDPSCRTLHVKKRKKLYGISVDINNFIDAITILAVVACFAEGDTHIHNAAIAKHKECDRIHCITEELRKMEANITETEDGLIIKGSALKGANLHSHHDHRMAMSLSVAALGAKGESLISSVNCISKTFPTFMRDLNHLGANITLRSCHGQ